MTQDAPAAPIVGKWAEWRSSTMCAIGQGEGPVSNRQCAGGCWADDCWCICHLPADTAIHMPRPVVDLTVDGGIV